jgi:hypothetical protein
MIPTIPVEASPSAGFQDAAFLKRPDMAAIKIKDLRMNRELDRKTMSRIAGAGGAPWVFGWATPYVDAARRAASGVNFFQTNYFYIADQMNNQIAMIDIDNTAANAVINVDAKQQALNGKLA